MAPTLQIIGFKKSGKTTLIEALVKLLAAKHVTVSVLKHDAHQAAMDVPGTDTSRFSQAGAQTVILASASGIFMHQAPTPAVSLTSLIHQLPSKPQLILAEGFKQADFSKLALLRPADHKADFSDYTKIDQFASLGPHPDANLVGLAAITDWFVNVYLERNGLND